MMLSAAPLETAFNTPLVPADADADLRHKRRERVAAHPKKPRHEPTELPARAGPRKNKKVNQYALQCNEPYAPMNETGPRCGEESRGETGPRVTCPHCQAVLGLSDIDEEPSPAMLNPFDHAEYVGAASEIEELPLTRELNAAAPAPKRVRTVAPPRAPAPRAPAPSSGFMDDVRRLKPEVAYALIAVLGLLIIVAIDGRKRV